MEYESGTGTNILKFSRIMSKEDASLDELNWKIKLLSNSSLVCTNPKCLIQNGIEKNVDLSFLDYNGEPFISPLNSSILIDSSIPMIRNIYSIVQRQHYCYQNISILMQNIQCNFTAGDSITVMVKYSSPIVVSGFGPHLKMYLGNKMSGFKTIYAMYNSTLSNDTDLAFSYEIEIGTAGFFLWRCIDLPCSISLGKGFTFIRQKSTTPTLNVNLTIPQNLVVDELKDKHNQVIMVDTSEPKVVKVKCVTIPRDIFVPGDIIEISINFDIIVHVTGAPILYLDIGNTFVGQAQFINGSESKCLTFQYKIPKNHCSLDSLDYLGVHGLDKGSIKRFSQNPTIQANLRLPIPGNPGSLSFTSNILVDCRVPFINDISSPQHIGKFSSNDTILIIVKFSRPVVVDGFPSLLLETGRIDREAVFLSQPNEYKLEFGYTVQVGDWSYDLDYWTNEGLHRSSVGSFRLNGGSVKLKSMQNSIVDADIHLNAGLGFLDGTKEIKLNEGVADFLDLRIAMRGFKYKIRFQATPLLTNSTLEISFAISIDESCEYELELVGETQRRDTGDFFGKSVSIHGNLVAVGAPHKRNPTPEIQVLSVSSDTSIDQHEVQLITTAVNISDSIKQIQRFTSSANAGEHIGGNWAIEYLDQNSYLFAAPVIVPFNIGPDQLNIIVSESFPTLGKIQISREINLKCNCTNAYIWTITFIDASEGISLLQTRNESLSGVGSEISSASFVKKTSMLSGNFTLVNPYNGAKSRDISFSSNGQVVKSIIEEDLNITVKSVKAVNLNYRDMPQLGRRWTIEFNYYYSTYGKDVNVPNLEVLHSSLQGSSAMVWTHVPFEGRGALVNFLCNYLPFEIKKLLQL